MRARARWVVLAAVLAVHAGPSPAAALRVAIRPATSIADVQTHLASIEPDVQRCAEQASMGPARVIVNVHLAPQGAWSVSFGMGRRAPPSGHLGASAFEQCVGNALLDRIGPRTERVPRTRTISRRFRVTRPVPTITVSPVTVGPLSAGQVVATRRVLGSRRAGIQACFPRARRAPRASIRLRVEVAPDGAIRLTGLEVPAHLEFASVAQCLERALDGLHAPAMNGTLRGELGWSVEVAPAASPTAPVTERRR